MSLKKILWLFPFMSFLTGYIILDIFFRSEFLSTPALVGLNVNQAISILSNQNLNLRLLTYQENPLLEHGTIINQTPVAGQVIKENQSVYVVVSTKPAKLKMPNFINKLWPEIQKELTSKNITAKTCYIESCYPKNSCFAQLPGPDSDLEENQKIIVYISKESSKPCIMPNFKGKRVNEVIDFLATYTTKIDVFHTSFISDQHTNCDCVIADQRPIAGSVITKDSQKKLHIQLQV